MIVVSVLSPVLPVEEEPTVAVRSPSDLTDVLLVVEPEVVVGTDGEMVVVVCELDVDDCAIAELVIMTSAAAPAKRNLVMCDAFLIPAARVFASARFPTTRAGWTSGAGSDSTYARRESSLFRTMCSA